MGKRADDDNRALPGKLKNPFDGQENNNEDDKNRIIPGKLKNPFDGQDNKDGDRDRNIPGKLKNKFGEPKPGEDKNKSNRGRKTGRKEANIKDKDNEDQTGDKLDKNSIKNGDEDNNENPAEDVQDKNKLLTYLSLATEPEAFKNVYADANPEICSFFNNLNTAYKPVIDKILNDKANKINDLNNKNLSGKGDKGDNPTILEPFNLNSLPEKEKYDEGVVLSLAKLYNYILDQSGKNDSGEKRPVPGKLSDDRFDDMGKRADDDNRALPGKLKNPFDGQENNNEDDKNRIIPGKLKNPFDGQDNKDGDRDRNIPGKLKNKFGEEGQEEPKLNKYGGKSKKEEDDEKYKNVLNGNLTPEDPVNNEFINNLEVLADPVYNPENYVFVNKFNNEIDKINE